MKVTAALGLAFVVCVGCQSQGSSGAETETQTQTAELEQAKASTVTESAPAVPTEEDFEEEVAQAITEDSDLGKELDALEQEIGE